MDLVILVIFGSLGGTQYSTCLVNYLLSDFTVKTYLV